MSLAVQDGASPLYAASQNGHTEAVDTLLKSGADPNMVVVTFNVGSYLIYVCSAYLQLLLVT